jgi:ankyrin repeat protein
MVAARAGRADVVDRLLKAGAKVDRSDFTGRTALNWSQESRNSRVGTLLRQAGAR